MELTIKTFYDWFRESTIEIHDETKFLILTDYENVIEIDVDHRFEDGKTGWEITECKIPLTTHQKEILFEKVEDFIRPEEVGEQDNLINTGMYNELPY